MRIEDSKEQGKPDDGNVSRGIVKTSYEHQQVIDWILKIIATCPMDFELKSIMRMRVWGKDPLIFAPMSTHEIAKDLGCKDKDIERWERDAQFNIEQFLRRSSMVDISAKYDRDNLIKGLINPN